MFEYRRREPGGPLRDCSCGKGLGMLVLRVSSFNSVKSLLCQGYRSGPGMARLRTPVSETQRPDISGWRGHCPWGQPGPVSLVIRVC